MFTLVPMSYLAVDAFLLISATVNAYHLLKVEKLTIGIAVRHLARRFFRNFMIVAVVMFTAYVAMGRLVQGPISDMYFMYFNGCSRLWWSNLLPISNFYPNSYSSNCLWWTWYFALDF